MIILDKLNFDGSCYPNRGGRMGYGWIITWDDNNRKPSCGCKENEPSYSNTNVVAEYLGLLNGIKQYIKESGKGPILIMGDSRTVIDQMNDKIEIDKPHLEALYQESKEILNKHNIDYELIWIPRYDNKIADELATPNGLDVELDEDLIYIVNVNKANISKNLRKAIKKINEISNPDFKTIKNLRVGGWDCYSEKSLPDLQDEAGMTAKKLVAKEFPYNSKAQASALRWMLRGLRINTSIKKVKTDLEIYNSLNENKKNKQKTLDENDSKNH